MFTGTLPSNDTHTHGLMTGIYEVTVKMGLVFMIYIPSFIKIGSGIQKLIVGIQRLTDSNVIS
jgi:hypothetical protein